MAQYLASKGIRRDIEVEIVSADGQALLCR